MREGNVTAAYDKIKEQNVLPSVCGRICSAPCEKACVLNEENQPVDIRSLERYVSDFGRPRRFKKDKPVLKGKKIAIVGSGPTGLTASAFLARLGYQVTIFESLDKPGGILRYGIPEFRIPKKVLDAEIREIESLGVEIVTGCFIGQTITRAELFDQGFAVMLLAMGAGVPKFLDIKGTSLGSVYYGEEFLMRMNLMKTNLFARNIPSFAVGNNVVVIGSGNTAMDCARSAARLGRKVTLLFRRTEDEMRVKDIERQYSQEEGIAFEPLTIPLEIIPDNDNFAGGLKCMRMDYAQEKKDENWKLIPVPGSEFVMDADTVVIAVGHNPNVFKNIVGDQIEIDDDGSIVVDAQSGMTTFSGVFAAGNVVTNAGPVVEAMAAGKYAATQIDDYLKNLS